jgi:hypothetical protein
VDNVSALQPEPVYDVLCQHGFNQYTCSSCHWEKQAKGLYAPECNPRDQHDFGPWLTTWLTFYCQRCGEAARWDD